MPARWVPPKPAPPNDVEIVRQIVNVALSDGMEIVALMALLRSQNENGVNANLSNAGAAQASIVVRNSLFTRLVLMVTREFALPSREGDLHLGRAFELLKGDTLAIFQGVGSPVELAAAIEQWQRLRGDHRLPGLIHFRDKQTAHLGAQKDNIPAPTYTELFALHVRAGRAVHHRWLCPHDRTGWGRGKVRFQGAPAHVAARLRLHARQQGTRYPRPASLPWPPQHPAHGQVHRAISHTI